MPIRVEAPRSQATKTHPQRDAPISFDEFRGEWNYTIAPSSADPDHPNSRPRHARRPQHPIPGLMEDATTRAAWIRNLTTPEITGIPTDEWNTLVEHLEQAYRQLHLQRAGDSRDNRPARTHQREHALTAPFEQLMLATVLHQRHHLPATQISRLIKLAHTSVSRHINALTPLFAEHGYPITYSGAKTSKIEHFQSNFDLPHPDPATRNVTS